MANSPFLESIRHVIRTKPALKRVDNTNCENLSIVDKAFHFV